MHFISLDDAFKIFIVQNNNIIETIGVIFCVIQTPEQNKCIIPKE